MKVVIGAALATLAVGTALAEDNSVINALRLCSLIDQIRVSTSPCEVSGANSPVIVTIDTTDTTSSKAQQACVELSETLQSQGTDFSSGWTLQIKSPNSGGKLLAVCNL
ncbi:hypothetical protein ACSBOB_01540 [Mesorhizobium sp. ASY16-5R]|uniref:hypothetical protein n=1 Tax=Mesorhizobium sp. ASY16-5R TaxID=3445772 RepID=UPI003FA030AA